MTHKIKTRQIRLLWPMPTLIVGTTALLIAIVKIALSI